MTLTQAKFYTLVEKGFVHKVMTRKFLRIPTDIKLLSEKRTEGHVKLMTILYMCTMLSLNWIKNYFTTTVSIKI